MTVSAKHKFHSNIASSGDATLVQPDNWNDDHNITMAAGNLLGRLVGADGVVQEIPIKVDAAKQSMTPPGGTTAARPALPANGMFRYNSTTQRLEGFQAGVWQNFGAGAIVKDVAPNPAQTGDIWYDTTTHTIKVYDATAVPPGWVSPQVSIKLQTFKGDGVTKTFPLSSNPGSENNLSVFIGSSYVPKTAYDVNGTTLTFLTAPPAPPVGQTFGNIEVEYLAEVTLMTPGPLTVGTGELKDGSVTNVKIGTAAVTTAKIADNQITYAKIQKVSGPNLLLGRMSAGSGNVEEIPISSFLGNSAGVGVASGGTNLTFLGIGTSAKKVILSVYALAFTSSGGPAPVTTLQLGRASGMKTSGYLGATSLLALVAPNSGGVYCDMHASNGSYLSGNLNGVINIEKVDGNRWSISGQLGDSTKGVNLMGWATDVGAALDRVSLSIMNGTFASGRVSCLWS